MGDVEAETGITDNIEHGVEIIWGLTEQLPPVVVLDQQASAQRSPQWQLFEHIRVHDHVMTESVQSSDELMFGKLATLCGTVNRNALERIRCRVADRSFYQCEFVLMEARQLEHGGVVPTCNPSGSCRQTDAQRTC